MRRRQMFALAAQMQEPLQVRAPFVAAAPLQTEMKASEIMMLSEAKGGEPAEYDITSPSIPSAAEQPQSLGGAPCPKCGRALAKTGRHFHIRKCNG